MSHAFFLCINKGKLDFNEFLGSLRPLALRDEVDQQRLFVAILR